MELTSRDASSEHCIPNFSHISRRDKDHLLFCEEVELKSRKPYTRSGCRG